MKIDDYLKKKLVNGLKDCAKKTLEETDLRKRAFYLAQCNEDAAIVMKLNYDSELVLLQFALEISSRTIASRIETIISAENETIPLPENLFEKIVKILTELATKIESDEKTHESIEKLMELAYVTTPSGYSQLMKGQIKI